MPNVWWMPIQTRTEMLATGVRSPLGIQVLGRRPRRGSSGSARRDRGGAAGGAGHAQRVRRADRRRLLPRLRHRPRRGRALRPERRGRRGRDRDRHRRRDRHHDRRGARALPGHRALRARVPRRIPELLERVLVADARRARRSRSAQVARHRCRATGRRCCATRAAGSTPTSSRTPSRPIADYVADARPVVAEKVTLPAGYRLEWAGQYQLPRAGQGAAHLRGPGDAGDHLPAAVVQHAAALVEAAIVMLAVPFSLVGAFWLL